MKTIHTFNITEDTEEKNYMMNEKITPRVNMSIDESAKLTDMFDAFEHFLLSVGYVIPKNHYLGLIEEE